MNEETRMCLLHQARGPRYIWLTEKIEGKKEIDETEKSELKKRTNLISISDLDELEEIESEKTTEKRDTEFKNEELQEAWREYVNSQKEKGKSNFATTLDMNKPVLLPNCKIEIPHTLVGDKNGCR